MEISKVLGIVKAYSSCVGEGPFVTELFGDVADKIREVGKEYGAATGRPRRIGWFDVVATRHGALDSRGDIAVCDSTRRSLMRRHDWDLYSLPD